MRAISLVVVSTLLASVASAHKPHDKSPPEGTEAHPGDAAPPHKTDTSTAVDTSTTAGFVPPQLLDAPEAEYPPRALIDGVEGVVELKVQLNPKGGIDSVAVVRPLGHGLDEAAVAAVRKFTFLPARYDGAPVPCTVKYHFHFKLPVIPAPVARRLAPTAAVAKPAAAVPAPVADTSGQYGVVVRGRRALTAASAMRVRDRDFLVRPHPRPADILQVTPGMYVAQHAGGGKANQYFLRGFDADHGTDVALFVDGVPVNSVSHGHGQGYADLHFVIPELVETIEVTKGPYFAQLGDFATAGAMNMRLRDDVDASSVSLTGDRFNTLRGVAIVSPQIDGWRPIIAAETYHSDGPFQNEENLLRFNLFARVTRDLSASRALSLTLMGYGAGWNGSGQIPQREVDAGRLDRYGAIDPNEGGSSNRFGAHARYTDVSEAGDLTVMAYVFHYRLSLFSNFTFFSRDPTNGDMIEQTDRRLVSGLDANYAFPSRIGDVQFRTTFGMQARNDVIDNALYYDRGRERLSNVVDAKIFEAALSVYAREDIQWTSWLRTELGLRGDYFGFDVEDRLEDRNTTGTQTSGTKQAALLSPKLNVVVSPAKWADMFLNVGYGFHSNDARGVVRNTDSVTPLTRALGYEVGARVELMKRIDLAASLFALDLDSEIVWIGDEGTTEVKGPSLRLGAEAELRVEILPWLRFDTDVTLTRARFKDVADDAIPLAPRLTVSSGLSVDHRSGVYGRLGVFHLGSRPATEDRFIEARAFTRLDATAGYRTDWYDLSLAAQNLLNGDVREAQFATVTRLPSETTASSCPSGTRAVEESGTFAGCEDLHFAPGVPINVQGTLTLMF